MATQEERITNLENAIIVLNAAFATMNRTTANLYNFDVIATNSINAMKKDIANLKLTVVTQSSPPTNPVSGKSLWYNPITNVLSIYYNDGNSNQWIQLT